MNSTTAKQISSASQSIRRNNGGTFAIAAGAGATGSGGGFGAFIGPVPALPAPAGPAAAVLLGVLPGFGEAGGCGRSGFIV